MIKYPRPEVVQVLVSENIKEVDQWSFPHIISL